MADQNYRFVGEHGVETRHRHWLTPALVGCMIGLVIGLVPLIWVSAATDAIVLAVSTIAGAVLLGYAGLILIQYGLWSGLQRDVEKARRDIQRGLTTARRIRERSSQAGRDD